MARIGIDLGTTNSLVSLRTEDEVKIIAIEIAKDAQSKYDCWSEYLFAVFIGKMYAFNILSTEKFHSEKFYIKRFINRDSSSINDTPWDLPL